MKMQKPKLKWILFGSALCCFVLLALLVLLLHQVKGKQDAFLTTSSPLGTYIVYLTGQKERPLFFTVGVRFNVLKNGKPYILDKYMHSGDSLDLSFESGYPSQRWLNESTIQFYREQYFNDGEPDTLIFLNNSKKSIKYLKVESVDKFLLFDLNPGSSTKMLNSRSRGDSKWLSVAGEFSDGTPIFDGAATLRGRKDSGVPISYCVYVNDDKPTFQTCR
jgi:hypothetical protein